nr:MAG TPA: hypothetical protein [Caudoviricetes sp.]
MIAKATKSPDLRGFFLIQYVNDCRGLDGLTLNNQPHAKVNKSIDF